MDAVLMPIFGVCHTSHPQADRQCMQGFLRSIIHSSSAWRPTALPPQVPSLSIPSIPLPPPPSLPPISHCHCHHRSHQPLTLHSCHTIITTTTCTPITGPLLPVCSSWLLLLAASDCAAYCSPFHFAKCFAGHSECDGMFRLSLLRFLILRYLIVTLKTVTYVLPDVVLLAP